MYAFLSITKDKVVDYQGERSLSPILEFVRRVHGPAVKKVSKCDEMKKFLDLDHQDNRQVRSHFLGFPSMDSRRGTWEVKSLRRAPLHYI